MTNFSPSREFAVQLDQQDLSHPIANNSPRSDPGYDLPGRQLARTLTQIRDRADEESCGRGMGRGPDSRLEQRLVGIAHAHWRTSSPPCSARQKGQVMVGDQTSINLFKLATAALTATATQETHHHRHIQLSIRSIYSAGHQSTLLWETAMKSFESAQATTTLHPISPRLKQPSMKIPRWSHCLMSRSRAVICTTWRTSPSLRIAKARWCSGI